MKKRLFIGLLVAAMFAFPCGESFAKKVKKNNPIKAPVVIKTEAESQETEEDLLDKTENVVKEENKIEESIEAKEVINNVDSAESIKVIDVEIKKEEMDVQPVVQVKTQDTLKLIEENPCNKEVEKFFSDFSVLQNKHNIAALKKLYSDDFINTDGYNKTQLFTLMSRTYTNYPDLKTEYQIKSITTTKYFAIAHVNQNVTASTKDTSKITKDKGIYKASLETVVYLKKFGKEWKIYSEEVLSEVSALSYGMAKDVDAVINAPQKVLAGNDYSASVIVDTPDGYSAIASVNNTQIVEGYNMNGETFRQVPADSGTIERVLKSNDLNNNEAVVVSVGFTKLTQDMFKKAKMDIAGLMILMRRVDIIPQNSNHKTDSKVKNEKK